MSEMWSHQREAVSRALAQDNFAFFMSVGTGKTRTAIEMLRRIYQREKKLVSTLIVTPLSVQENWKSEFLKFSKIKPDEIVIPKGTGHQKEEILLERCMFQMTFLERIVIINYESMLIKDVHQFLIDWAPRVMILDESHRIKNHKSKRAKAILKLSDQCQYKYILSGTPILNSPADIFMQYRFLDGGKTFGFNFYAFQRIWFEDENAAWAQKKGYFPKYAPKPELMSSFNDKIYTKAYRATREECLDLPPLIKTDLEVEMSPEQWRMYKEMKQEFVTFVESLEAQGEKKPVIARLALTKALRLQQITSGFCKTDDGEIISLEDVPREKVLEDLLEDLVESEKVIVWSVFIENYKRIERVCEKLGVKYVGFHGQVEKAQRDEAIESFKKSRDVRVFISNPSSGGEGINLQEAGVSIFYSRGFSLLQDQQAEARNYRGGSEIHSRVLRYNLIAKNTIDELISEALSKKLDAAELILDFKNKL